MCPVQSVRPISLIAALGAVIVLSACSSVGTSVSRVEVAQTFEPTEAGYLGGLEQTLPTVIWYGPGREVEALWLDAFSRYRPGAPLRFTAASTAEGLDARHRVMILFTPPMGLADGGLCRLTEVPGSSPVAQGQGTPWRVAYCVGDRTRSEAAGVLVDGSDGSGLGDFGALVPELALRLFPIINPHRRGERCILPGC